ncbi:MAG: TonB-dependent receptor [Holophagaceae bacterium]|nr:TonB-dependent receptor [Holophagaceae bacterium]
MGLSIAYPSTSSCVRHHGRAALARARGSLSLRRPAGAVFRFDGRLRPTLTSAFIQNDLHFGALFLALGLRHDAYTVADVSDNQLQPRLGLSYRFDATGTVLGKLRPPDDPAASTDLARAVPAGLGPGTLRGHAAPAKASTRIPYSYGIDLGRHGRARDARILGEAEPQCRGQRPEFLNTGVLFPVSADRGHLPGREPAPGSSAVRAGPAI